MALILGGMTALSLGMVAEACSSSSSTGSSSTGTGSCAALTTCCGTLTAAEATNCTTVEAEGESACATYLTSIKAQGLCTGTTGTPDGSTPKPDTGTTPTPDTGTTPPVDTGTTPKPDTGTTPTPDGGSTPEGGAGSSDCRKAPYKPFAETDGGGVYCPFSKVGDGGKNSICTGGTEHCCVTPESANTPSTCEPLATACPVTGSVNIECEGTPDCTGQKKGTVCCGYGTINTQAACGGEGGVPAYPYVSGFNYGPSGVKGSGGSFCAESCSGIKGTDGGTVSAFQICSQTSECTGGATCVGIDPSGVGLGYCQP